MQPLYERLVSSYVILHNQIHTGQIRRTIHSLSPTRTRTKTRTRTWTNKIIHLDLITVRYSRHYQHSRTNLQDTKKVLVDTELINKFPFQTVAPSWTPVDSSLDLDEFEKDSIWDSFNHISSEFHVFESSTISNKKRVKRDTLIEDSKEKKHTKIAKKFNAILKGKPNESTKVRDLFIIRFKQCFNIDEYNVPSTIDRRRHYKKFMRWKPLSNKLPNFPHSNLTKQTFNKYIDDLVYYNHEKHTSNEQLCRLLVDFLIHAPRFEFVLTTDSINNMIEFFVRCGQLNLVNLAIEKLEDLDGQAPNIRTFNALLVGIQESYKNTADGRSEWFFIDLGNLAVNVFEIMSQLKIQPDNSTFLISYDMFNNAHFKLEMMKLMISCGVCLNHKLYDISKDTYNYVTKKKPSKGSTTQRRIHSIEEHKRLLLDMGILDNVYKTEEFIDKTIFQSVIDALLFDQNKPIQAFEFINKDPKKVNVRIISSFTRYFITNGRNQIWNSIACLNYFKDTFPNRVDYNSMKFKAFVIHPLLSTFNTHPFGGTTANVKTNGGYHDPMPADIYTDFFQLYKILLKESGYNESIPEFQLEKYRSIDYKLQLFEKNDYKEFVELVMFNNGKDRTCVTSELTTQEQHFKHHVMDIRWSIVNGVPLLNNSRSGGYLAKAAKLGSL
ncbi:hypothetical protein CANARDRAFT_25062 [[Candida] arabinofermentans NRRL YB-2248]|uniref:Uncharacterized protein n=1 Tax=[Candida] arabinofermentans NRRL YB-2248 TaxID=983967 RepID=A0A1E4SV87_9ASCO|nr:hypothetical protein CANARDRAFT_25062 [[Candida] arabinofermentans NRRL YB-2248]